jgi:hypothetical protein
MKKVSTHAAAAKAIRKDLKKAWPMIKFSVTSDSYSGGNSVIINWTNGPTYNQVNSLTSKYEYGHFDGMFDSYEYSNLREDIPQVKYVQHSREISEGTLNKMFDEYKSKYNGWENLKDRHEASSDLLKHWGHWTASEYLRRECSKIDYCANLPII